MPEEAAHQAIGNKIKYILSIVLLFLAILSILYYKHIEHSRLSRIKEYNQSLSEFSNNPKLAASLINQIDGNNLGSDDKQKLLIQKAIINSSAKNLPEYADALKQIIDIPSFSNRKRGYMYVNLAKHLESQGSDVSLKKYLAKSYPEIEAFSNLEASLYFLSKAEEIDKTPYIDMLRARYSAYKISPENFTEKDLISIRNYLESANAQTSNPKDSFIAEAGLEEMHNKAITELYLYSLTKIKPSEENSPVELEKKLLLRPDISTQLKIRAFVVYLYAITILEKTQENSLFTDELLKNDFTEKRISDIGLRESSEMKRHFSNSDVQKVLTNFPNISFIKEN